MSRKMINEIFEVRVRSGRDDEALRWRLHPAALDRLKMEADPALSYEMVADKILGLPFVTDLELPEGEWRLESMRRHPFQKSPNPLVRLCYDCGKESLHENHVMS